MPQTPEPDQPAGHEPFQPAGQVPAPQGQPSQPGAAPPQGEAPQAPQGQAPIPQGQAPLPPVPPQGQAPQAPVPQGQAPVPQGQAPLPAVPPHIPVAPPQRRSRAAVLVGGLLAVLLVAALIVVGLRMSDSTGEHTAETSSPSTSQSSPSSASPSDIEAREAELAEERGWTAGKDYIPSQAAQGRNAIDSIPPLDEDSGMALGPADAPVTVRVFGDFSCPMCTRLHHDSMPELEEMARDGKIRLEWRNFPIFEERGSDKAARGSIAAAAQGKLWEYLSAVYGAADDGDHPTYTDESVRALAESAELDMARFDADYGSQDTANALEQEKSLAQNLGLSGTPTILIGHSYVSGAYPTDVLTNTIDLQTDLAKK